MRLIVEAAVRNNVALEINANSGYPHERFIRMVSEAGAKFTFGSNNFDDRPHDMSRCLDAIATHGLTGKDMYLPVAEILDDRHHAVDSVEHASPRGKATTC